MTVAHQLLQHRTRSYSGKVSMTTYHTACKSANEDGCNTGSGANKRTGPHFRSTNNREPWRNRSRDDAVGHCDANRTKQKTFSSVRDYNRADFDKIKGQLQNINWDELLDRDTVEEAWGSFKQLLYVMEETYIPTRTSPCCHRRKPLWLTNLSLIHI